jgi:endoglucanase
MATVRNSPRRLIALSTIGAVLLVNSAFGTRAADGRSDRPFVHDVTMGTPDLLCADVRDPAFAHKGIVKLPAPRSEPLDTWIRVGNEWGKVIGPNRDHARISDIPPPAFLDRGAIDRADLYDRIAGRRVVSVHRTSLPYDSGIYRNEAGETRTGASLRHTVCLKLDGPLPRGRSAIKWPGNVLPETAFTFEDTTTRAIGLHVNQNGYAPADTGKVAFLSLWLPKGADNGAIDFRAYGIDNFSIIDSAGAEVFRGKMRMRAGPRTPEPGNGLGGELVDYATTDAARTVEGVTGGRTAVLRVPGHAYKVGQRVMVTELGGPFQRLNGFHTVAEVGRDVVALAGVDGSDLPLGTGVRGAIVLAHRANRAGTFVFELDFGAWRPAAEGEYRVRVPGLGVSPPFPVSHDTWLRAARASFAGLYHQRSGIALDGRFGYTRPASMRPGQSVRLVTSKMPLPWSTEFSTGFRGFGEATSDAWRGPEVAGTDLWGGYMDAGDWDSRSQHIDISYLMLDLYDGLPESTREVALGLPKSGEVLDRALYGGTDALPDLIHEAIWNLDFFRRMQHPDGSISGGMEAETSPHLGLGEPSFLYRGRAFVYAPDHVSTFRYAGAAARLALALKARDDRLSRLFEDSARAAWAAGEKANADPEGFYAEAIDIAERTGGFGPNGWAGFRGKLQGAARAARTAAAGALTRLSGEAVFVESFEASWRAGGFDFEGWWADGAWDYLQSAVGDSDTKEKIRSAILNNAVYVHSGSSRQTYPNVKHFYAPMGWGHGLAPDYNSIQLLMRSHRLTGDPAILTAMQNASGQVLGANQLGLSFTTGIGQRTIKHPLHEDHRAMGVDVPAGITVYGWAPAWQTQYFWVFGPPWTPLPVSGTAENAERRRIEPDRYAMPIFEHIVEHPGVIMQQEYAVHQTIGTTAAMWLYLHGARSLP